jgi:uncharacterized protein YcsI (UPF0317 family)
VTNPVTRDPLSRGDTGAKGRGESFNPKESTLECRFNLQTSIIVPDSRHRTIGFLMQNQNRVGKASMMIDTDITTPQEARLAMRRGDWTGPTVYKMPGFVQCNLVVLAKADAYDFLLYCQRNPKACPLIDVTDAGDPEPRLAAPGADLRTDLPRYAIYRRGERCADVTEITGLWRNDSVAFLIGSSLTFDQALERAGVPRSQEVWVLATNQPTQPAGKFKGPLVVTMRWMTPAQAVIATQLSTRFPYNHGAPVHVGDPAEIGADLGKPIFGEPVTQIPKGILPVFWACGVTPQRAALEAKPELMVAHAPGHAFITDLRADRVCIP